MKRISHMGLPHNASHLIQGLSAGKIACFRLFSRHFFIFISRWAPCMRHAILQLYANPRAPPIEANAHSDSSTNKMIHIDRLALCVSGLPKPFASQRALPASPSSISHRHFPLEQSRWRGWPPCLSVCTIGGWVGLRVRPSLYPSQNQRASSLTERRPLSRRSNHTLGQSR